MSENADVPESPIRPLRPAEEAEWAFAGEETSLTDLINRVLDRGVVAHGDVTISVAGVDLVYLGLNALLTSVSSARRTLDHGTRASREPLAGTGTAASLPPGTERPASTARPISAASPRTQAGPAREEAADEADPLAAELVELGRGMPERLEIDPEGVQRDLARLVLTLVELLRRVVEHQAVQRMDDGDLSEAQVERMGNSLAALEAKLQEIKAVFGLADDDLNIDLGPLGKLL